MSRYANGVRVMRVRDEIRLVAFTRAEHDDNAELQEVEKLSDEELANIEAEAKIEEQNEVIVEVEPDDDGDSDEEEEDL